MLWVTDRWQDVNRTSTTCLWKSEATAQVEPLRAVVATDSIYLLSKSDRVALFSIFQHLFRFGIWDPFFCIHRLSSSICPGSGSCTMIAAG